MSEQANDFDLEVDVVVLGTGGVRRAGRQVGAGHQPQAVAGTSGITGAALHASLVEQAMPLSVPHPIPRTRKPRQGCW